MKRIIYSAAIAALLVTSCQKTDVLNVAEDTIEFSTNVGKLTKAGENKLATLEDQGFRVWAVADFTQGQDIDGEIYRGISNLSVIKTGETYWDIQSTQNQKYFWPQSGKHLYFYTLSALNKTWLNSILYNTHFLPKPEKNDKGELVRTGEVTGLMLPAYTVGNAASDDIMVADHIHQHKGMTPDGKTVKPLFRHTMTKVQFNFKKGAPAVDGGVVASTVILKKIEIKGLDNSGELSVTYSSGENDKMSFEWKNTYFVGLNNATVETDPYFVYTPESSITISKKDGSVVETVEDLPAADDSKVGDLCIHEGVVKEYKETISEGSEQKVYSWETADQTRYEIIQKGEVLDNVEDYLTKVTWYMIPQDLENQTVKIYYTADGKHIDQEFALSVEKEDTDVTKSKDWYEETCVKYNVTIAPHKIMFKPDVEDWNSDINGDKVDNDDINMNN